VLRLTLLALVAATTLAACSGDDDGPKPLQPATESGTAEHFAIEQVADGLNRPTWVGAAPGDAGALYVLEQPGRLVRLDGGRRRVLVDLTGQVTVGAEQGLLGIAFDPDFATSRKLYLHWSDRRGDTAVGEFVLRGDRPVRRPVRRLLEVDQPEENHNGGQLAFGPDGRLYLGLGDGGGAFDPRENAQNPDSLLGKIIAADVRAPRPRWDVVLLGLRNPWRFWFDPALGELWIADVGQDDVEEVNRVLLELDEPPKNLGWDVYEGTEKVGKQAGELRHDAELVWPVAAYTHEDGCSVTGGLVYGGTRLPGLSRRYVYGDFCTGALWTLRGTPKGRATDVRRERVKIPQLVHIGTDSDDELVFASGAGRIYRAVPAG
jgi:glucose/arabinose dehydrogenase